MSATSNAQSPVKTLLTFGPYRLDPVQHVLLEADKPVRLGSRALEILLVLLERAGEVVSRQELMARVWPDIFVEEGTLRVHVAALRKVLSKSQARERYVENFSGRGYRFAAPVTVLREAAVPVAQPLTAADTDHLPASLTRMVGRMRTVSALAARFPAQRFVTIVGPGGIGKTTVAVTVARQLSAAYPHKAHFVDLATLSDERLVPITLASVLGLAILAEDPVSRLVRFLKDKQMLIVLDNCEHVIDAATFLAEKILMEAPGIHVIATSREPLRAHGERIHRLTPLAVPPPSTTLTAADALTFSAVELFVERATASLDTFTLDDSNAHSVAEICRRLDGNPFAIELAAARVDLFGAHGLAARLDDRLQFLTKGRRTSLPRQQTLRAALDWSYKLLSPTEQTLLCRLAVFAGSFDFEAAAALAADETIPANDVLQGLTNLAAKSLITADVTAEQVLYRLLDTPRNYALEKLTHSHENIDIRRKHALLCCDWGGKQFQPLAAADWSATNVRKIDDVAAAVDWCFSPSAAEPVSLKLCIASLWFRLALIKEYRLRLQRAQETLEATPLSADSALEPQLNLALANALLHTKAPALPTTAALVKALEIARQIGDGAERRQTLWAMWVERIVSEDCRSAVEVSEQLQASAEGSSDRSGTPIDGMLAVVHRYAGNHAIARRHIERALSKHIDPALSPKGNALLHCHPRTVLSHSLWLQGFPDQAAGAAKQSVAEAVSTGNEFLLCYTLLSACAIDLFNGDMPGASRFLTSLKEISARNLFVYWQNWARCLEIAVALRRGDLKIQPATDFLPYQSCGSQELVLLATLSEELLSTEAIAHAQSAPASWHTPEILRATGELTLKKAGVSALPGAEALFRRSLAIAHRQDALSWELRSAMSLARLLRQQGQSLEAYDLLAPVFDRFTEGFTTFDLVQARTLLKELAAGV
jgi:predicted ATPase/DNA-binding winged helix-turn-helix (wHTH) protein